MTGPAEAMSPPPSNVTEADTPELKVYLLSLTLVIVYPPDALIVAAGKFATFEEFLNLTVSLVDLPWFGSLTVTVVDPLVIVKGFGGRRLGTAVSILATLTFLIDIASALDGLGSNCGCLGSN